MPIRAKETVLLICDIQDRFRTAIWNFDAVVSTSRKMIKAAKLLDIPVVTTEQNPRALGATVGEVGLDALPKELNLGVFAKTKFSMHTPEIADILRSKNISSAIIVGIEAHVCVLQTALGLLESSIKPYVLADGVSSCNSQEINIALETIRHAGGVVSTSESILFQLVGDASEPNFKPMAGLVKEEKASTASALSALLGGPSRSSL
ncbi:Isochorismatase hydrolase [Papiliotrema laurentii]|uniref:Isochorismatase hydrolase n=1 Tax=Papiliotrema laurentii TaxID=5418 RepID=A0AAD9FQ26_PAPLA|nr:Isochorismatase hydrolase [Papiliotrema laurentii]